MDVRATEYEGDAWKERQSRRSRKKRSRVLKRDLIRSVTLHGIGDVEGRCDVKAKVNVKLQVEVKVKVKARSLGLAQWSLPTSHWVF